MPRTAREKSGTGIYHEMIRGINRQTMFNDDEDEVVSARQISRVTGISANVIWKIASE